MSSSSSSVLPPAPASECPSAPCPVTCAKNLILRAWRERWSDVQWAVRLKPVLRQAKARPQGGGEGVQKAGKQRLVKRRAEGDAIDLSRLLLDCALVGPSPNALIMGYLKHSLAAGVVSYPSVLRVVASFDRWERPHCSATLLDLVESFLDRAREGGSGRAEDAVALAASLLHLLSWLLRLAAHSFEALERSKMIADDDQVEVKNYKQALDLVRLLLETDHSQAMLYVGREEEKDTWKKVASGCKLLSEQVKQCQVFVRNPNALKVEVTRLIGAIKNLDPGKAHGPKAEHVGGLSSYAVQPVIVCEALCRPTSDLGDLSFYLHSLAISHGAAFSDVAFQIFRGSLSALARKPSAHALKLDAFVLVRLPTLLDRLASLMRIETGAALKTPTETYKALDRLVRDEPLLDEVDSRFECNILDVLLKVVGKCSPALITETEATDVAKRRKDRASSRKLMSEDASITVLNSTIKTYFIFPCRAGDAGRHEQFY